MDGSKEIGAHNYDAFILVLILPRFCLLLFGNHYLSKFQFVYTFRQMHVYYSFIWVVSEINETLHSRATLECYFGFKHFKAAAFISLFVCLENGFGFKQSAKEVEISRKYIVITHIDL